MKFSLSLTNLEKHSNSNILSLMSINLYNLYNQSYPNPQVLYAINRVATKKVPCPMECIL